MPYIPKDGDAGERFSIGDPREDTTRPQPDQGHYVWFPEADKSKKIDRGPDVPEGYMDSTNESATLARPEPGWKVFGKAMLAIAGAGAAVAFAVVVIKGIILLWEAL
jgi:hypothetical protein